MNRMKFLTSLILCAACSTTAQWVQTSGPCGGEVECFAASGNDLFLGSYPGGVYHSTNDGALWTFVPPGASNLFVLDLATKGPYLFLATAGGLFRTSVNGTTWVGVDSGFANTNIRSLGVFDSNLFVSTWDGTYLSTDDGSSWMSADSGLPESYVTCRIFRWAAVFFERSA